MTTLETVREFLATSFPQTRCVIEELGHSSATVRHPVGFDELRPGGTVSGPVMMATADLALYVAIFGTIGIVPLAVTTNLNITFLRKPSPDRDILAVCRLLKVGKTLAMGEVALFSVGSPEQVAHAMGTYSIPRKPALALRDEDGTSSA